MDMNKKIIRVLSLGAGVQSSTLALMAEHGEIEKPDCAIFADTGWEPKQCYDWLNYLESKLSYPVIRVSKGNIKSDLLKNINGGSRFASIPFFTSNGGMGRRQCTNEYKLIPIMKKCRELLGYGKGKRIPKESIEMLIGISTDEAQRMRPSRVGWIKNTWTLIDLLMSRNDCLVWMRRLGYPRPPKSSCNGCPYHSDAHWQDMKINDPVAFADSVTVDEALRSGGGRKGMELQEYMHRSLKPLSEVEFSDDQYTIDMFGDECQGICGV